MDEINIFNFGEMSTDVELAFKNYNPLHSRITSLIEKGHQGIDAIFEKDGKYYIVESKYGSSTLGTAKVAEQEVKQMSDAWILDKVNNRLFDALDGNTALENTIRSSKYVRVISKIDSSGNIIFKLLDSNANEIGDFIP